MGGDETAVGRRVRIVDAREYHQRTNHSPERLRERSFELDYDNQPRPYKLYADVPTVDADWRSNPAETPVLEAVRPASADPPDAAPDHDSDPHLPTLCHYAAGVTKRLERRGQEIEYRAAACTGKLYHVDLYAVAGECGAFDPGVYHFDPDAGAFDVLRDRRLPRRRRRARDVRRHVRVVAKRLKYRERTYHHAFWDAGTVLANLLAVAHGSGHRAELVAGFADDSVVGLLGLDPAVEAPVALVPVGSSAPVNAADAGAARTVDPDEVDPIDLDVVRESEPVDYPLVPDAWRQSRLADGAVPEWRERFGNRGYRLAQLEAGVALGRLYLATYAHLGFGGRGFTFFDERVADYLGSSGQLPMTLFAFGKPGESARSDG